MNEPFVDLNPRRPRRRERPLEETIRDRLVGPVASPAELARELDEPLSIVAFHWRRQRPGPQPTG